MNFIIHNQANKLAIQNNTVDIFENCIIDVKSKTGLQLLFEKTEFKIGQSQVFELYDSNHLINIDEYQSEPMSIKIYSNHRLIFETNLNDFSKCFVLLSNKQFEKLTEQLIKKLSEYTNCDILHYTIGYESSLSYPNLINIANVDSHLDFNDPQIMQFIKPDVFLETLRRGYKNCVFIDSDVQIRNNINSIFSYFAEINEAPIFQKTIWPITTVQGKYIPSSKVAEVVKNDGQEYSQCITNIVLFNKNHLDLIIEWRNLCQSDEVDQLRKTEFIHDELLINMLLWKHKLKPQSFQFLLNVKNSDDVKYFYSRHKKYQNRLNLNDSKLGWFDMSMIDYDENQIIGFHSVKDYQEANTINQLINMYDTFDETQLFKTQLLSFYDNIQITDRSIKELDNVIDITFNDGPKVEIIGTKSENYNVKFIDADSNKLIHEGNIMNNMWIKASIKYFVNWKILINDVEQFYTLKDKNVLIKLESSSLGDTLAWAPYAIDFQEKHQCKVYLSTFINDLFIGNENYKNLNLILPGQPIQNLIATYAIGWYKKDNKWGDVTRNPNHVNLIPLQKTATDILGLDFYESHYGVGIKPGSRKIKEKYVVFAPQSTSGLKEWELKNWSQLADKLAGDGFKIISLSKTPYHISDNIENIVDSSWKDVVNYLTYATHFIGLGSGLSWLNWTLNKRTFMINAFSDSDHEFVSNIIRITNDTCIKCWNHKDHTFDPGDWNWCPEHKNTPKQFICQKSITPEIVYNKIITAPYDHFYDAEDT